MTATGFNKWILGIIAALIVATTVGGIGWASSTHAQIADTHADIAVLQEQTRGIEAMQETLEEIRIDVAALRSGAVQRDRDIERRLERIERLASQ